MEKMVEDQRATQEKFRQELRALFQGAIRITLEMVLEEEVKTMVGARRFERIGSRQGHRKTTFLRRFLTSVGRIDVAVPRSREWGSPVDVLGSYRRPAEEIDEMITEACVGGVSQRKMAEVTEALMGGSVGRSAVSRVAKRLEGAVEKLRTQPIEGPHGSSPRYLAQAHSRFELPPGMTLGTEEGTLGSGAPIGTPNSLHLAMTEGNSGE